MCEILLARKNIKKCTKNNVQSLSFITPRFVILNLDL